MDWDLVVIFTFVIVLTAVRSHYKRSDGAGAARVGTGRPDGARACAWTWRHRLEQRVETLERVLDEDAPGWRARVRA